MPGRGPDSTYDADLAAEICDLIAAIPRGLAFILAQDERYPTQPTFNKWVRDNEELAKLYEQARRMKADNLFDECIDIADDATNDTIVLDEGGKNEREVCNTEFVQRSRLRIDTRKWMAGKLYPQLYGDKIDLSAKIGITSQDDAIDEIDR